MLHDISMTQPSPSNERIVHVAFDRVLIIDDCSDTTLGPTR